MKKIISVLVLVILLLTICVGCTKEKEPQIEVECDNKVFTTTWDVSYKEGNEFGTFRVFVDTDIIIIGYTIYEDGVEVKKGRISNYALISTSKVMIEYYYYPDRQTKVVIYDDSDKVY